MAVLILAILIMPSPTWAAFTASVDQTTIASHESIELTLRTDQDSSAAPDLKPLEWSFDILGTRQSRQVRIINGRSESFRDWIVTLMPKQTGTLVIPPLYLGSETSEPITIRVRKNLNDGSGSQTSSIFMKASVSRESIYVQQELVLTLQILYRVPLYDENRLSPLEIDDVIIQQLGETRKYDTVIEGSRYSVFELKYAIHPQKIGLMEIPSLTFSGVIAENRDPFGSLFSRGGKPIVARSPQITIEVKPQPDTYPNHTWLPARNLDITETWSQSLDNLKVGDAITRTITVDADGLGAAQLPPVLMPQPEGVNSYPDRSNTKDMAGADGIRGQRTDSIAMIPTRPGTIHLPAVSVTWFDTESGEPRVASIPEKTLKVLPGENQQPSMAPPITTSQTETATPQVECPEPLARGPLESAPSSILWQLLTALFALLWLVSTALWLQEKRQTSPLSVPPEPSPTPGKTVKPNASSEAKAFASLESACR
ncbi:MAG: BatD family protein, partial [Endozoicomonas sp.]